MNARAQSTYVVTGAVASQVTAGAGRTAACPVNLENGHVRRALTCLTMCSTTALRPTACCTGPSTAGRASVLAFTP